MSTLWPWAKRLISTLVAGLFIVASLIGWIAPAQAQTAPFFQAITQFNINLVTATPTAAETTAFANPCDSTAGQFPNCGTTDVVLRFGNGDNRILQSFVSGGQTLEPVPGLNDTVLFRREGTVEVQGTSFREVLFYESTSINTGVNPRTIDLAPDRIDDLEGALRLNTVRNIVNLGIDNVFHNSVIANQDTRNNIERIDYILRDGVVVPPEFQGQEGFLVLERVGGADVGDAFRIAAITSLDANGDPASYGPLRPITTARSDWGVPPAAAPLNATTQGPFETVVFRRETPLASFQPSHSVGAQPVGGLFFPINQLLSAPESNGRIYGYSLVAADVPLNADLTRPQDFLQNTDRNNNGGLDLILGGFSFFRVPRPLIAGNLFLNKRITRITAAGTTTTFTNTEADATANNVGFPALVAAGLGQGAINVTNPELQPADEVEYTVYFNNTGELAVDNVQICDQIPPGTTFVSDTFGVGVGVEAIPPSNTLNAPPFNYPTATYTNAADGDPATFLPPGSTLPAICGADRGNGALVINVGTVRGSQVGSVRFLTRVNPFLNPP